MVLVEYCRHGNLHQYLHRHKNSFINQVHSITGEFSTEPDSEVHTCTASLKSIAHTSRAVPISLRPRGDPGISNL